MLGQTKGLRILFQTQVNLSFPKGCFWVLHLLTQLSRPIHVIEAHLDHVVEVERVQCAVQVLQEWVVSSRSGHN